MRKSEDVKWGNVLVVPFMHGDSRMQVGVRTGPKSAR